MVSRVMVRVGVAHRCLFGVLVATGLLHVGSQATWGSVAQGVEHGGGQESEAGLTFEKDIRPILRAHCLDCHGATAEVEGGLDLRQVRLMLIGGDSGPAIVAGEAHSSLLVERIKSGEMPPGKTKVKPEELATLEAWIANGARTLRPESETLGEGIGLLPEDREWWAFQPLEKPAVPMVDDPRVRNDIDRFVLAKLRERGLDWSDEADRRTLAIRLSVDLTGLPPSYEQLQAMLADEAPGSYERWVEQLLDSPAYGERWARHWLDVVGYADSDGFTSADLERAWAFHYRDWVVRSLQADLPIDQFIQQQLAGDELFTGSLEEPDLESWGPLVATGFLRMAADGSGQGGDEAAARQQTVTDALKIVSSSLLGMTVACAQCHDHRYDPILQEDYYRLRAVFAPAMDPENWVTPAGLNVSLWTTADREAAAAVEAEAQAIAAERAEKEREYLAAASEKELAKFEEPLRGELSAAYHTPAAERTEAQNALLAQYPSVNISPGVLYQYDQAAADRLKEYDAKIAEVRAKKPPEKFVRIVREPAGHQPQTFVFHRGDPRQPTKPVAPGDLSILYPIGERQDLPGDDPALPTTGRRLAFARHLTAGRHPLFNRVFVNRIWMHHFGRGIVPTPADFGRLGEAASHPELLDWLACELADGGWSLKHLHRLIVTSHAYRQSSLSDEARAAEDAESVYLWRYPLRRLEAEALRDRVLQVSGALELTQFGPPVALVEDETGQVVPQSETRRSLYLQVRRSKPVAFLQAFDQPIMETNCERRDVSTVAPQALMLLNSGFMGDQAKRLADRCAELASGPMGAIGPELSGIEFPQAVNPWHYGYAPLAAEGVVDPATFVLLPHRANGTWQGGPTLPDPVLDWCLLTADGGHPGTGFAVVRRFVVPYDGLWRISGTAGHGSESGDGVRMRWILSDGRTLGDWNVQQGTMTMEPIEVELRAGETLDWVVDARESVTSDTFSWQGEIVGRAAGTDRQERFVTTSPPADGTRVALASRAMAAWRVALLRDPTVEQWSALSRWMDETAAMDTQAAGRAEALEEALVVLCRALLGSNEFLYVD